MTNFVKYVGVLNKEELQVSKIHVGSLQNITKNVIIYCHMADTHYIFIRARKNYLVHVLP